MRLSLCMATFKRGAFIAQTMDSVLAALPEGVEIVVVDGASPDETPEVMARYAGDPRVRYVREAENSGVDRDYDKAVGYATGEFCWMMTDDDLLVPGAVARVLQALTPDVDLVVVNSQIRDLTLERVLQPRILAMAEDRDYDPRQWNEFFADTANYLSFIGGVVIRREIWRDRDRQPYYGSLFIHMGVIFQGSPLRRVRVLADPLILIRYGNAMWTARGFEIWMFMWPRLVWSFPLSDEARRRVTAREPWRSPKILLYWRGLGTYSLETYRKFLADRAHGRTRVMALAMTLVPIPLANLLCVVAMAVRRKPEARLNLYNLLRSPAARLSRALARLAGAGDP